ncbi:HAMP domain-containing sensor histidine kinase [Arthrobacter sp. zg-Y820]|uniref:sensor histidine kinase n=1 Tax=unclassified Arthrobacter TaxID=235627 RepID=UPI001E40F30E|nr:MULTISPECIES: HAMP domain-containing sensor histidine kinase [unclassified Arthrobacter]MCC9198020.1 HAMP domain-containing histidine kinase [Arthrobacter sp. zg-Y820]MDK1280887.1 HAMP domain-containing sensor histidine kinase [Arthrobacter sp. zg.Y820]WIB10365.1 HAMP domain-containing sensor histidine kinase [Arthrobacter sp. zg-Y820]
MSTFERRVLALMGIRREFHELSLRLRVALSQLPLLLTVLIALPLVAAVSPQTFREDYFQLGLVLLAAASSACLLVPWQRLFHPAYWVIPLLDFAVICCLYNGGRTAVTGLSLLCVYPVFWLAWSGTSRWIAGLLSFSGTLLVVWAPLVAAGQTSLRDLASPMLIPFVMLGIFCTVVVVEQDTTAQHTRLLAAENSLQGSLQESRVHSQLLNGVLETVDVGVMALDATGRTILMNSRQRINHALAGLGGDRDPGGGALIFGLDQVTKLPHAQRPTQRAMREESFSDVIVWVGTGKSQRALAVCARALRDHGTFAGSVLAYSDVTDVVNALNAKEDFVSSVSHELRTPLTSIIGYLDLALDDADEQQLKGPVRTGLLVAQRNAERLLTLVSDLLTTASGIIALTEADADLAELVHTSLDSAATRAEVAGIRLLCDVPDSLPVRVDSGRILQVLDNLLSNAIKYSPDGGKVTVRAWAEPGTVVLEVADNGMGMSPDDQLEVFTKFFRTGQVKKAAIPGVGLGLVITKSIVEAHSGKISFESELGVGTAFRVELPLSNSPP